MCMLRVMVRSKFLEGLSYPEENFVGREDFTMETELNFLILLRNLIRNKSKTNFSISK